MSQPTTPELPLVVRDEQPFGHEALTVTATTSAVVVSIVQEDGQTSTFELTPTEARLMGASLRKAAGVISKLPKKEKIR